MWNVLTVFDPATAIALAAAGVLVGLVGGLLGIGGGVISVPVLLTVFASSGLSAAESTAMSVGTAQASIVVSSIAAVWAHSRARTIDWGIVKAWTPAAVGGGIAGLGLAPLLAAATSQAVFACVVTLLGFQLLAGHRLTLMKRFPESPKSLIAPFGIGILSSAVGVGAGTLSGPVLAMLSVSLQRAVGAGAIFNLAVSLPAAIGFAALGIGKPGLPFDSIGYVSLGATLLLGGPSIISAPVGARLLRYIPQAPLRLIFAGCLFAIAAKLLWQN